jgi:type II secretory pathway pseudopilin PulG
MMRVCAKSSASAGFTFVELSVAAAVMTVALAAILTSFIMTQRGIQAADNYVAMNQSQRKAFDWLTRDVRQSTNVVILNATNSIRVVKPYNFKVDGTTTNYATITFFVQNKQLRRISTQFPNVTNVLARDVSSVTFTQFTLNSRPILRVTLNLQKTIGSKTNSESITSQVALRNKG